MRKLAAASLVTVTLVLVAFASSHAGHYGGRVIIGGPAFYWGPSYYPYYPPGPYYDPRAEAERQAMAQVRFTSETALLSGCTRLGSVKDNDVKDLRRKIVRAGGNAAALSFGVDDLETILADVYRCTTTAKAPASSSAPASTRTPPPPPAGTPPPPPPPVEPTR
jgi:hypothetical protein